MRFITKLPLILAASASLAAAKDATTTASTATTTKCAAHKVVEQCLLDMKFELENCISNDWDCKCTGSENVANCYDNCPEDPNRFGAQQIREQNCINAKAYGTHTTMTGTVQSTPVSASSMRSSSSASAESTSATPTGTHSGLEENNGSESGPTKSLSGLEATSTPSKAAAATIKVVGGWMAFLGLGLGALV
ncbi:uncharacterized protein N7498_004245 [Penicillium cinerascens]|uniref:GPI anchored serine-threonine rich protein n=1 Tax=Penicillium cinerascens TaxID=70096 RepID=A0A9W9T7W5_9EURO|nr:uncharacterized protein N7498_004245 [Penicillium cinerascens]KAJ5212599.1 hypothetical protein N7498_004245 [Penicillium cinerascens]